MNIQIFIAVIAAFLIVTAAYYYLNWKAMLYLGGLFLAMATIALFLNYQNDGITLSIPAGNDLFRRGGSVSILGEYRWLALLGLLTGVVLMIASAVKRIRMPPPKLPALEKEKPLTEKEKIAQAMDAEIQEVKTALGDPGENGEKDAHDPGGVMPDQHASEPQGFERDARDRYQTLGTSFVQDTVRRLMAEIGAVLAQLDVLKNTLVQEYYAEKATSAYRDDAEEPDPVRVARLRSDVTKAGQAHDKFVADLRLHSSVQPEWDKPTSTKQLVLLGVVAAIIEFSVSYLFLKGEIGVGEALAVATVAMVVVFMLAFLLAANFRFMRRPHTMLKRVGAGFGYAIFFGLLFLGLGLLLEYRTVKTEFATSEISDTFRTILAGYGSVLTNINNLVLFLINLAAFVLFYCKCLLWFERFSGYHRVRKNIRQTEKKWDDMFDNNSQSIKTALGGTSKVAKENREGATKAVNDLHEKKDVLENIQASLTPSVKKMHIAYRDSINAYRTSNVRHRNVKVNPRPAYFKSDPAICVVKEHFTEDHGIDEFLAQHQEAIAQADDIRQQVEQAVTDWPNQRAQLNIRWTEKFQRKIDGAEN